MMMTGAPIKLTQADAADVADLYNRCSDYFLLQDGAAPTLDDARELFSDVPPEKSAHNQAVLGWKGPGGLYAIAAILRDYPRDGTWCLPALVNRQRPPPTLIEVVERQARGTCKQTIFQAEFVGALPPSELFLPTLRRRSVISTNQSRPSPAHPGVGRKKSAPAYADALP
mgnify:CR=1 FL=1